MARRGQELDRRVLESVGTERAILGSVLMDPDVIYELNGEFRPELFTVPSHINIAKAFVALNREGRQINIPAVLPRLPPQEESDEPRMSDEGYLAFLAKEKAAPSEACDLLSDLAAMHGRRKLAEIGQKMIQVSNVDDGRDPSEVLDSIIEEARAEIVVNGVHATALCESLTKALDMARDRAQGKRAGGMPWFMSGLDGIMGPLEQGNLIGVLCDPKMGKTSFGLQCARHAANFGETLVFSHEMSDVEVSTRLLSQESRVSEEVIAEGKYSDAQFEACMNAQATLNRLRLHIIDKRMTVAQMRAKCMEHKRRHGLVFVLIDHLKLIRVEGRPKDRWEGFEQIMSDLKNMAKDLDVPVMILMQRTRESIKRDNPRPQASDAFGGGATIENVNSLLAIWRPEEWLAQHKPTETVSVNQPKRYRGEDEETQMQKWEFDMAKWAGKAELINLARRRGKGNQSIMCRFHGDYGRFDPDHERQPVQRSFVPEAPF